MIQGNISMQIHELWQYPVNGIGGNQMPLAKLQQGNYFPNDRQFAISIGDEKTAAPAMEHGFVKRISCN